MSERRVGILIGFIITIGGEIAVAVVTAAIFLSLYYPGLRAKWEGVQNLEIPRSEVLELYGDRATIPYLSLQMYLATKGSHANDTR